MSVTAELWVVDGYCSKVMFLLSFISVLKLYLVIVYVNIVEKAFAFCFFYVILIVLAILTEREREHCLIILSFKEFEVKRHLQSDQTNSCRMI